MLGSHVNAKSTGKYTWHDSNGKGKGKNLYLDPHKFYWGDLPHPLFNNKIVLANETHTIGFKEHSALLTNQIDNNFENN